MFRAEGADCGCSGGMPDRANLLPAHRGDESFEVFHRRVPGVVSIRRGGAVAVTALIVAVHVADRVQPLCKRAVDPPEKSGRVQSYYWLAGAAPVQSMQRDAVNVDETGFRFR